MAVYNSIQLDLCKKNSYKAIPTKQLDTNSRFLRVELLNNGNSYDFNDDVTVILASTRNGETKAYKCTVEDGCVVAPLTSWMLAEEGYVDCEIVLLDTASNSKLSSFAFSICVDESIYNDETISQDENYNVLLQLIADVDTAVKSCNTATEKATEIYNTVETKLNNGELKGEKGDKGEQGDPYELTMSDIYNIVRNIPYASVQTAGILRVPVGCGLRVDKRGNADVYYEIPDLTSTTDDIIVEKQGGTLQGDGYCKLTFNSTKYAQKSELPTKTSELENDSNFVSDANYVHTDNNYTKEEKTKLGSLVNYDDTAIKKQIEKKQDKLAKVQLDNISAVPNKIDKSAVGNGLKFADGMLSVDIDDKLKKLNSQFELIQTVVFEEDKSSTVLWRKPVNADYVGLSEIMIICELYGNSGGIEEFSYFMGNDGKSSNELILFRLPRSFAEDGKYYKSISKGLFTQQGFIPEFNKFGNNKSYPEVMNQDNAIYSSVFSQNSDYITTLKLNTDSTAKSIGAGTKIYIWGVKKYE